MENRPKIEIPDSIKKIDKQIEVLEYQIMRETKEIDRLMIDREIHKESLEALKQHRMKLIDEEIFDSKSFLDLVAPESEEIKHDPDSEWILEEIGKEFTRRNPKFEGAQLIGFASVDEPNKVSIVLNSELGVMFLEVTYFKIVEQKKVVITKLKNISTDEEINW